MRISHLAAAAALVFAASPVLADGHAPTSGDAAAGEKTFAKMCVTCHVVVNDAGEKLAGRSAKTGRNLYGIGGATIGVIEGFRYGKGLVALGEAGETWTEEAFVGWVMDPNKWVREATGDSKVRSKMTFKVRKEADAYNLYAYLFGLSAE